MLKDVLAARQDFKWDFQTELWENLEEEEGVLDVFAPLS